MDLNIIEKIQDEIQAAKLPTTKVKAAKAAEKNFLEEDDDDAWGRHKQKKAEEEKAPKEKLVPVLSKDSQNLLALLARKSGLCGKEGAVSPIKKPAASHVENLKAKQGQNREHQPCD